jgi:spoIIIJ-associated protein
MICNKGEKDYYRITLDSCGYRAKRKVILEELAKKVSKNVLRTGRSQSLEPMNPYERRIIHATISQIDGVTSRSVGEEPFRKVIISSTNPKKYSNNRNRKGGYNNRNNNNKRGGNNKYRGNGGKKRNFQPRSLDLKTSFEKDYRKPKPEDNLKEGLYGKIEF